MLDKAPLWQFELYITCGNLCLGLFWCPSHMCFSLHHQTLKGRKSNLEARFGQQCRYHGGPENGRRSSSDKTLDGGRSSGLTLDGNRPSSAGTFDLGGRSSVGTLDYGPRRQISLSQFLQIT